MAQLAHSILLPVVFVDTGDYVRARTAEATAARNFIGISRARTQYLFLPDGGLSDDSVRKQLVAAQVQFVLSRNIDIIATLGSNGYCGHSDHIASHDAAVEAQYTLARKYGYDVGILALNHAHEGAFRIPVNKARKLGALAFHRTQMHIEEHEGAPRFDPTFEAEVVEPHYGQLFAYETYDFIAPLS